MKFSIAVWPSYYLRNRLHVKPTKHKKKSFYFFESLQRTNISNIYSEVRQDIPVKRVLTAEVYRFTGI